MRYHYSRIKINKRNRRINRKKRISFIIRRKKRKTKKIKKDKKKTKKMELQTAF